MDDNSIRENYNKTLNLFAITDEVNFSLKNELVRDNDLNSPWTSNIENLYSRGLLINFTFE